MEKTSRFTIGTKFMTRGKHARLCTVIDIWRTYNVDGELVRLSYVATHEFMGQTVTERDIPEATIARGLVDCDPIVNFIAAERVAHAKDLRDCPNETETERWLRKAGL